MKLVKRNQRRARREHYDRVFDFLASHPCVDCGEKDPVVLEFDHVRGVKTTEIARMIGKGYRWSRITEEIAKCDVRCANCHRRRTAKVLNNYRVRRIAAITPLF